MRDQDRQLIYGQLIYDRTTRKATRVELLTKMTDANEGGQVHFDTLNIGPQLSALSDQIIVSKILYEKTRLKPTFNISNGILADDHARRFLMTILGDLSVPAVIEVQESLYMPSSTICNKVFDDMRAIGFDICLADFGTGFHGMHIFNEYKFDMVKIDKSMIINLPTSQNRYRSIKMALESMAKMNLKTIIIGIESQEMENIIVGLPSNEIQGFLYHSPVHWKELIDIELR